MDGDYSVRNGVAVITFDNPPVNSLSGRQRIWLHGQLKKAAEQPDVKVIVVTGGALPFCGGSEIREFNTPAQMQAPMMPQLAEICEAHDKCIVAAIDGFAFGAGLELALAMHYRVATPDARLALPEVKFGFLPGAGGTQRLPRLIAMEKAAKMMLTGVPVTGSEALALGLVDEVVQGDLVEGARQFAQRLIAQGALVRRTRDLPIKVEKDAAIEKFAALRADIRKRFPGDKGRQFIIDCCEATTNRSFEDGIRFERELFLKLLAAPEFKALRHVFLAERNASKTPFIDSNVQAREIKRAAIVGAGTMGAGIAIGFANAGIPVAITDSTQAGLDRGMSMVHDVFDEYVAKMGITKEQRNAAVALVRPTLVLSEAMADVDLVIEAVFENIELKQDIFRQLDELTPPRTILATNTSMLDVNLIANVTKRPEAVIGTHFFSPAHIMRLLEVVRCDKTSDEAIVTVMKLAKTLGKAPVLSGVCDGFIGNRMFQRYLQQALFLLDEGCTVDQIDSAVKDWGMAMGPFAVGDLSGLDIGWSTRKRRYVENPEMVYSRVADRICEAGRLGRKTGKGWYRYEAGGRTPHVDPEVETIVSGYRSEIGVATRHVTTQEIVDRLILALANEGAAILQEGIAQRASDIDVVFTTGYGFPAFRGGPMFYANSLGLNKVVARMREFEAGYQGEQSKPVDLLVKLANEGRDFE